MKIVEGLKLRKRLLKKAADLEGKLNKHCSRMSNESPKFGDEQQAKVSGWLQAHGDIVKEISKLSLAIQKTNLNTLVKIQLGGKDIEKCVAEWILRRREGANLEIRAWNALSDKGMSDHEVRTTNGESSKLTVVRYYDPNEQELKVDTFRHEPSMIDSKLEVVNATTDLENYDYSE